jgi:murein DD-endopeptidase MepM/ murein hydrolase activator NlpD
MNVAYSEGVRWIFAILGCCAFGATLRVEPAAVDQGDVIRVYGGADAVSARMDGKTIRLFPQASGEHFGLMPVTAIQKPGRYRLELLNASGKLIEGSDITVRDAHFPTQNIHLAPDIQALQPAPGEVETIAAFKSQVTDARHWDEPFLIPINGCMSSPFGVQRLHNGKPTGSYHSGVDQRSPEGQPIHAIAAGVVRVVREYNLHGNVVGVDHGQGVESLYLHMSRFATKEGATVNKGDVLGYVGATGRVTGPHLHWNLYVNGVGVNPTKWVQLTPCAPAAKTAKPKSKRTGH